MQLYTSYSSVLDLIVDESNFLLIRLRGHDIVAARGILRCLQWGSEDCVVRRKCVEIKFVPSAGCEVARSDHVVRSLKASSRSRFAGIAERRSVSWKVQSTLTLRGTPAFIPSLILRRSLPLLCGRVCRRVTKEIFYESCGSVVVWRALYVASLGNERLSGCLMLGGFGTFPYHEESAAAILSRCKSRRGCKREFPEKGRGVCASFVVFYNGASGTCTPAFFFLNGAFTSEVVVCFMDVSTRARVCVARTGMFLRVKCICFVCCTYSSILFGAAQCFRLQEL